MSDFAAEMGAVAGPQKQPLWWCGVGEMGGRGASSSQPQVSRRVYTSDNVNIKVTQQFQDLHCVCQLVIMFT